MVLNIGHSSDLPEQLREIDDAVWSLDLSRLQQKLLKWFSCSPSRWIRFITLLSLAAIMSVFMYTASESMRRLVQDFVKDTTRKRRVIKSDGMDVLCNSHNSQVRNRLIANSIYLSRRVRCVNSERWVKMLKVLNPSQVYKRLHHAPSGVISK